MPSQPSLLQVQRAGLADIPSVAEQGSELALDLGRLAYENHHRVVYQAWLRQSPELRRAALDDRHVFLSVCLGFASQPEALQSSRRRNLIVAANDLAGTPLAVTEEWFKGLETLANALIDHDLVGEARAVVILALKTGAGRFPRIVQNLQVLAAYLDALAGNVAEAARLACHLVEHPYLLANRRELPGHYRRLMFILSAGNQLDAYREVIWKGAASADANSGQRAEFLRQIMRTYRGAFRAVLAARVSWRYRLAFLAGEGVRQACRLPGVARIGASKGLWWLHTGILHVLGLPRLRYARLDVDRKPGFRLGVPSWRRRECRRILVSRAMGGIGDILMMTPGLLALSRMRSQARIDFAVPKSFHPVLEGIEGIRLLDINADAIDIRDYDRWVNLTDCPAGRVEGRQSPNVRKNRIEIFAKAMGVSRRQLEATTGYRPFYRIRAEEETAARAFLAASNPGVLPVIGVQPYAADSYRNWPHMEQLVQELSATSLVLVFHHQEFAGFCGPNVIKVVGPLRESVALLGQCDKLVVVDSSFLHFSAALDKPAVAIFGAISGRLRTKDYPNVTLVAPSKEAFPCYPCWRHEHKPCHLTNGRESICLRSIDVGRVTDALYATSPGSRGNAPPRESWLRYGHD